MKIDLLKSAFCFGDTAHLGACRDVRQICRV
nr:MAG TPA_asm: hypothetical protein [Caudoviricetes sp.]